MGLPRIVYDRGDGDVTVNFPEELEDVFHNRFAHRSVVVTDAGEIHLQFHRYENRLQPTISRMPWSDTFFAEIMTFWGWAMTGGSFAFANDSSDMGLTLVDTGGAASGQKVIPVLDSSSFNVGQKYVIESLQDGWQQEIFEIDSKTATSITAVSNLLYSYLEGDQCRTEWYFPKVVTADQGSPFKELRGNALAFSMALRDVIDTEVN